MGRQSYRHDFGSPQIQQSQKPRRAAHFALLHFLGRASGDELAAFEAQLLRHLQMLTDKGIGYERMVLDHTHPLEYSLGWFKRRYFGHVDATGDRKILAELVFVRCAGNVEWDVIDYSSEAHPDCWWSVMYDIGTHRIEQVNYP